MTFQRRTARAHHPADPVDPSFGSHRRRRLRSEPRDRRVGRARFGRGLHCPRRRRTDLPGARARARRGGRRTAPYRAAHSRRSPGCRGATPMAFVHNPDRHVSDLEAHRPARPRGAGARRATRSSDGRSTSSRRRAAARSTAASARSSRCAGATSIASRSSACSTTSAMRAGAARARSSSSMTTSRSTSPGSRRSAARSSTPD